MTTVPATEDHSRPVEWPAVLVLDYERERAAEARRLVEEFGIDLLPLDISTYQPYVGAERRERK